MILALTYPKIEKVDCFSRSLDFPALSLSLSFSSFSLDLLCWRNPPTKKHIPYSRFGFPSCSRFLIDNIIRKKSSSANPVFLKNMGNHDIITIVNHSSPISTHEKSGCPGFLGLLGRIGTFHRWLVIVRPGLKWFDQQSRGGLAIETSVANIIGINYH